MRLCVCVMMTVPGTCWEFCPWRSWTDPELSFPSPWRNRTGRGTHGSHYPTERSADCGTVSRTGTDTHTHTQTIINVYELPFSLQVCVLTIMSYYRRKKYLIHLMSQEETWCRGRMDRCVLDRGWGWVCVCVSSLTLESARWTVCGIKMGPSSSAGLSTAPLWPRVKMVFLLFRDGLEKNPALMLKSQLHSVLHLSVRYRNRHQQCTQQFTH